MSKVIRVVRWIDSSIQNGQVDKDDFPKPETITSVGFVVEDTNEYVVLSRDDMAHEGDYRGLVAIPRVAVEEEIEVLASIPEEEAVSRSLGRRAANSQAGPL